MTLYQRLPKQNEAVQFTGENWAEMHDFTGHATDDGSIFGDGRQFDIFVEDSLSVVRLFVVATKTWKEIRVGDWIVRDSLGFRSINDECFKNTYVQVDNTPDDMELIPVLDDTEDPGRLLGRIRFALIVANRPSSEVEHISQWSSRIVAEHRVFKEHLDGR